MLQAVVQKDRRIVPRGVSVLALVAAFAPSVSDANGFGENRAWQFRTPGERASLAAVADVIEKKKGGYYDGFETIVYSTTNTNIGTQINCNTVADANANTADNSQSGNLVDVRSDAAAGTESIANRGESNSNVDPGSLTSEQSNSGTISSSVSDSPVSSGTGNVSNGSTNSDMLNDQSNSGNQLATIQDSTTCDMSGTTLEGIVDITSGDIATNAGPLN